MYCPLVNNTVLQVNMFLLCLFLVLGCAQCKVIVRESCDGDGSAEPNCRDFVMAMPELSGLSFLLPHESSKHCSAPHTLVKCHLFRLQQILGVQPKFFDLPV